MTEVGDIAMKIAGRDAGEICAVVEIQENYVLVDGATRRRKCNLSHLEFLGKKLKLKKNASTEEVRNALKDAGFNLPEVKKGKTKEKKAKPVQIRKASAKKTEEPKKKSAKK